MQQERIESEMIVEDDEMEEEYDFSKGIKNPYTKLLKQQMTIRVRINTINYFKREAEKIGIPYQTMINMYLDDCAANGRTLKWE